MESNEMYIQPFSKGNSKEKNLLGGKGANLAEMTNLGLPVPCGITITTEAWAEWNNLNSADQDNFCTTLAEQSIEIFYSEFGYDENTLPLLSVRSGARVSMPGMMDTILNVGILVASTLSTLNINTRTRLDCTRRFQQMFGETALGIPSEQFSKVLDEIKGYKFGMNGAPKSDAEMSVKHLEKLSSRYSLILSKQDTSWADSVEDTLAKCISAVFESWNSDRAVAYRAKYGYPDSWGTAVNIQQMVFGNMDDESCSGVLFTRNPSTGKDELTGEFLVNAQGEDVVAGIRTPLPLSDMEQWNPELFEELAGVWGIAKKLESHYNDMQDIEFTVESGQLYMLQTRNGKRSAEAAFKVAYDRYTEGYLTQEEALSRVTATQYIALKTDKVTDAAPAPDFTGLPASNGVVTGAAVFSSDDAIEYVGDCILVTEETNPDDFAGMDASVGILTRTGGVTSHAAVVARGMDKTCVVGCTDLNMSELEKGDLVTLCGLTGRVWVNKEVPVKPGQLTDEASDLLALAYGQIQQDCVEVKCFTDIPASGQMYLDVTKTHDADFKLYMEVARERHLIVNLDLAPEAGLIEADYLNLLGLGVPSGVKASVLNQTTPNANWSVRMPKGVSGSGMRAKGWKVLETIDNWDSLLSSSIEGALDPQWVTELAGMAVPVSKLTGIMIELGKSFTELKKADAPIERQLFEVLGKSV
jgi:pyruvate,orthophosphate dikinase